ncbi:MAG TPA: amino acid adenylation domain-containing protein [Patescibacteria group bacterium]|nr:amino acid adenylation domain-containing protein [Gammaproteobacteria bacterium]HWA51513.1 amino acid adenylation domain-containing protein [Patescibacteria group bacterium]
MKPETDSQTSANELIAWIRNYAFLHIDSRLANERRCFPPHIFLDLGNKGFFGMHISHKYGGLGLKTQDILRVMQQVAAIDLTLATVLAESIQAAHTIEKYAPKNLQLKYLPQLASGRILISGAMTEPAAGSNPRAMQATATPNGQNSWLINGHKRWVGLSPSASAIAVYVNQVDTQNKWLGMSAFLIPRETQGLHIGLDSPTMGVRGFAKNAVHLQNAQVTSEQLLGSQGEGMEIAQDNMMYTRLCLAAANVGVLKRCAQLMFRYAEQRNIATGQLLENPVTLVRLSELTTLTNAIENLIQITAELYDVDSTQVPEEAFVVSKVLASEYLGWAADILIQTLGARGYEENNIASQIFRDARTFRIFEGPTEALNMYIGSKILTPNLSLEHFFDQHLRQKNLFDEIKLAIQQAQQHVQLHKLKLFTKPLAADYWLQALAGEIVSYGLLLGATAYKLEKNHSTESKRAFEWVQNKFNEAIQKAKRISPAEASLLSSCELKNLITNYVETIGDIDQSRILDDTSLDELLKCESKNITLSFPDSTSSLLNKSNAKIEGNEQKLNLPNSNIKQQILTSSKSKRKNHFNLCIHELFENQAIHTPDAIATICYNRQLTYKELNNQANQLAHYLRRKGIGPNKLVAIYMERSLELVVGLLGILKAGGAYLPLDYNYPLKRLRFMFEDSKAEIILTQKKLMQDLPFACKEAIPLDDAADLLSQELITNPIKNNKPSDLVYVIYTSGSTGKPKGVMQTHKSLVNLLSWHMRQIPGKHSILQFTSLSFDMSFMEIFSALCSGGNSILISEKDRTDLFSLSSIIKEYSVEHLITSVAFLKKMSEVNPKPEYFKTLKEIITAGEQLVITPEMTAFFKQLPKCRLRNYYGPSETHVVTAWELPKDPDTWPIYPHIGKPIANSDIFILDNNKQLVPIDVVGEIYIGGLGLGKGYINDNNLTEKKFIQNPFSDNPEDKLYRTGDLGKYLPDGNIAFLGRIDDQVKVHGFRIELQEIESQLIQCPLIKEAVITIKENPFSDKQLIAFIIPKEKHPGESFIEDIRHYLRDHLPTYMIPSLFHVLENIPLTPSGKVDRQSLLKTEKILTFSSNKLVEPETKTEKTLVNILQNFFNTPIGVNHSIISIGGNSLLAMQIVSKLHDVFSVEIPPYSLLSDPSIAMIAQRIDNLIALKH